MSEYQYYEFRAIDRPLTEGEMAELRSISTRATITPTSLQNEYNWGDFRGDPLTLMWKYFDAFVYVANWGSRQCMLRLPATLLPTETASQYEIEPGVQVHASGDQVILAFTAEIEEPEWEEGGGWLDSLLPLRDGIARGDLRALYIGWLSAIWMDDIDDDGEDLHEPSVPPGLKQLSTPLRALADFLRVDPDLLSVAARRSEAPHEGTESAPEQEGWLRRLPIGDKDVLLRRVMQGQSREVGAELVRRFREDTAHPRMPADEDGRTMDELLAAVEEHREKRKQREREQAAREREHRDREEAAAREKYLQDLAGREEATWAQIEALLEVRRGPEYDQAARSVVDLRDVAQRGGTLPDFTARLRRLRADHASKPAFIRRLDAAKLR